MQINGEWQARSSYTTQDKHIFRTIGETVGTNVRESDIRCLAADYFTVRTGSENCWPYWLEGQIQDVGKQLDGTVIKQDNFVWLTTEGIECGTDSNGAPLTGLENCI